MPRVEACLKGLVGMWGPWTGSGFRALHVCYCESKCVIISAILLSRSNKTSYDPFRMTDYTLVYLYSGRGFPCNVRECNMSGTEGLSGMGRAVATGSAGKFSYVQEAAYLCVQ